MVGGHCIKCGKAYKNCDVCFPEEVKETEMKTFIADKAKKKFIQHIQYVFLEYLSKIKIKEYEK